MPETESFHHVSVLAAECIDHLNIRPSGVYIDATMGGGGHSERILERLGETGRLIGIDRDSEAIAASKARLNRFGSRFTAVKSNFADIESAAHTAGVTGADGILFDLGVSSHQLDTPERGFSYMHDAPLDMRMDTESGITAAELIASIDESSLAHILSEYGEERFAGRIAAAICTAREKHPIRTTRELSELIASAIPAAAARAEKQHPAKRSFQAIRIAVNGELDAAERGIRAAAALLNPGGRLCVISFHSLEDRLVKRIYQNLSQGCTCPRDFPVCVCGAKPMLKIITSKPVTAGDEELQQNPRARSAKLRVAEKIAYPTHS